MRVHRRYHTSASFIISCSRAAPTLYDEHGRKPASCATRSGGWLPRLDQGQYNSSSIGTTNILCQCFRRLCENIFLLYTALKTVSFNTCVTEHKELFFSLGRTEPADVEGISCFLYQCCETANLSSLLYRE